VYSATSDPRHPTLPPPRAEVPPFINFAPIDNALAALTRAADRYQKAAKSLRAASGSTNFAALNQLLLQSERRLTLDEGLPRRPWYKHMIYAPGWYTGYSPKTMPGVREAIEEKRYADADPEIAKVSRVLQAEANLVDEAAVTLEQTEAPHK
jgi:N-acetylated-alpha-linked acidic dipeptidase